MDDEIELAVAYLGHRPYVLIEITDVHDDGDLSLSVRAGGGVESREDIADLLELAREGLKTEGSDA